MKIYATGGEDPRTKELLFFFIKKLGGDLGRTKLIKLAYLTDLFARMTIGGPVTNYRYRLFENGPFDPTFYETVKTLEKDGCIEEKFVPDYNGHRYSIKKELETATQLSGEERFIAERVVEEYGRLPLETLLDEIVYRTEPARKAKDAGALKASLDMEACNDRLKKQLGLSLSSFLASKKAFEQGQRVDLDELIKSL